jgi:hypothetical protein
LSFLWLSRFHAEVIPSSCSASLDRAVKRLKGRAGARQHRFLERLASGKTAETFQQKVLKRFSRFTGC